jgi:hypothetical protein
MVALGAPALKMNSESTITIITSLPVLLFKALKTPFIFKVKFFISILLNKKFFYFPIPIVALGAPALITKSAMVRIAITVRPLLPCNELINKVNSEDIFFMVSSDSG